MIVESGDPSGSRSQLVEMKKREIVKKKKERKEERKRRRKEEMQTDVGRTTMQA